MGNTFPAAHQCVNLHSCSELTASAAVSFRTSRRLRSDSSGTAHCGGQHSPAHDRIRQPFGGLAGQRARRVPTSECAMAHGAQSLGHVSFRADPVGVTDWRQWLSTQRLWVCPAATAEPSDHWMRTRVRQREGWDVNRNHAVPQAFLLTPHAASFAVQSAPHAVTCTQSHLARPVAALPCSQRQIAQALNNTCDG